MTDTDNAIRQIEWSKDAIRAAQATYRAIGPNWESNNDARASWFTGMKKALILGQAHLILLGNNLTKPSWWQSVSPNFTLSDLPPLLKEAEVLYRWTTLHLTYTQLEESLRRIASSYDAPFMARRRSIASITNHLLDKLNLRRFKKLFQLARNIRNTLHNNGLFLPDDRKNRQVTWNATTYKMRVGRPISFLSWRFITQHVVDMAEAMSAVVTHRSIAGISEVGRRR